MRSLRPVTTYSIVARDPATGSMGVAVQSHYFSVGSIVTWAEPGVGAVATQAFAEISYGPLGLERMRAGQPAPAALAALLATDPDAATRQVAMVDSTGTAAAHTGPRTIREAAHHIGAGYAVQANMMLNPTVVPAMSQAFERAGGDLPHRMLAALVAAEGEGGDIRGRQSAAMVVVDGDPGEPAWRRELELRVEDHPEPLAELKRLIDLRAAYRLVDEGDARAAAGDMEAAGSCYRRAHALAPGSGELQFWHAVTLAAAGAIDEAAPMFDSVFAGEGHWRELLSRLPETGLFGLEPDVVRTLTDR